MAAENNISNFIRDLQKILDSMLDFSNNTAAAKSMSDISEELESMLTDRLTNSIELSQSSSIGQAAILSKIYDLMSVVARQSSILSLVRDDYFSSYAEEISQLKTFYSETESSIRKLSKSLSATEVQTESDLDDPYLDDFGNIIYPDVE